MKSKRPRRRQAEIPKDIKGKHFKKDVVKKLEKLYQTLGHLPDDSDLIYFQVANGIAHIHSGKIFHWLHNRHFKSKQTGKTQFHIPKESLSKFIFCDTMFQMRQYGLSMLACAKTTKFH